jgi:hypothetical protein
VNTQKSYPTQSLGNSIELAKILYMKYRKLL